MAKRKYHILHGKTKSQRDALVKNPGLRLLHANASGFHDFEQNPGRRRRLKAMKNPAAKQMEMFSGSPEEQMELFAEVGKGGVTVTPDRRIKGAKIKGKRPEMKASDDWSGAREALEEMAEKEEASERKSAPQAGTKKDGSFEEARKAAEKALKTAQREYEKARKEREKLKTEKTAAQRDRAQRAVKEAEQKRKEAEKSLEEFRTHARPKQMADLEAKRAAKERSEMYAGMGVRSGRKKPQKDIIDRLAEGIGSIADIWGERKPTGPKGPATKETIVGFDMLARLKGLSPEQAAKLGYQLGVIRGIDTCGIFKSRERKEIRQKASMELQNAVTSLEKMIIGGV